MNPDGISNKVIRIVNYGLRNSKKLPLKVNEFSVSYLKGLNMLSYKIAFTGFL